MFRTQQTPKIFPDHTTRAIDGLKTVLHPLCDLDNDLIDEHMNRFQPGTRQWALDSFDEWIQSTADDNDFKHRVFVLAAPAGVGKTGIACKIVRSRSEHIVACHFCRHDDSRRSSPKHMLLSLAYQLACRFPGFRIHLEELLTSQGLTRENLLKDYNIVALFDELLKIPLNKMEATNDGRSYVVVVDALDECEESGKNEILLCLQRHFRKLPSWIHLFVTTRPEIPVMDKLKNFSPTLVEPSLAHNIEDLRIFFRDLLTELNDSFVALNHESAVEVLVEKSGGLFIYADHLATMLRTEYKDVRLTLEDLDAVPSGLEEFHEQQLERLLEDTECLAWRIVEFALVAQEPLHVELIQALMDCSRPERIAALHKLSSFFLVDTSRKLHIYHKSLSDWLTDPKREDLEFFVNREYTQQQFANRCWRLLRESGILSNYSIAGHYRKQLNTETESYLQKHGIHHLVTGGMELEARSTLLDVGWLMVRSEAGAGYEMVQDCQKVGKDNDKAVALIGRALGLSLNALRKDPRQLPGQLIARLLPSLNRVSVQREPWRRDLATFVESLLNRSYGYEWWCPMQATWDKAEHPCSAILEGHTHIVYSVAWCPDGSGRLVSGGNDKTVRIWLPNGECDLELRGHTAAVNSVSWSPDGTLVASASSDKTIRVWRAASSDCELVLSENEFDAFSVAITADHHIVTGHLEEIKLWDQDGALERLLLGHRKTVRSLAVFKGGPTLASGSDDSSIRVWNVETGVCNAELKGHDGPVNSVKWGADSSILVSGGGDRTVRIWNILTKSQVREFDDQSNAIYSLALSPDNTEVCIGSKSSGVEILNLASGRKGRPLGFHLGYVHSVSWGTDGKVATASADGTIKLWNPSLERMDFFQEEHFNIIRCKEWSSDGNLVATGADDREVRLWSAQTGRCVHVLKGHKHNVSWVCFSRDNECLVSTSWDKTARIWDVATGTCIKVLEHEAGVTCAVWSYDSRRVTTASIDHRVRVFSADTGKIFRLFGGHVDSRPSTLAWSNDDRQLLSGHEDGSICWLDVEQSRCTRVVKAHASHIHMMSFTSDGKRMASASHDKTCCVWDMCNLQCIAVLKGHESGVHNAIWSIDSNQLLTRSRFDMRVWDVQSGECQEVICGRSQIPANIPVNAAATVIQDFSLKAPYGVPVGVACDNVQQYGNKAVAKVDKALIRFFQLVTPNSPAPSLSRFQEQVQLIT